MARPVALRHFGWRERACVIAAMVCVANAATGQTPRSTGDTGVLHSEVDTVRRVWLTYLASKKGQYSSRAGERSDLWAALEQRRWPVYDLAGYYLADGASYELMAIEETLTPELRREYRIKTRFRSGSQRPDSATWWTSMTVTVYAERDGGRWVLSNALSRNVRTWTRDTVGPITYVFPPGYPYDAARAHHAIAFVDSVSAAFGLPRIAQTTYYLTSSVDEVYRIMGLESSVKFGPAGGAAQPVNHQIFSGTPAVGEEYRHELAHLLFAPICCARTSYLISEGVATWIGGTTGLDFPASARSLAAYLDEHPRVTLDSIMTGAFGSAQIYPAGAVITATVFERRGAAGIKELFTGGRTPGELRTTLEHLLERPWPAIADDWRLRVAAFRKGGA